MATDAGREANGWNAGSELLTEGRKDDGGKDPWDLLPWSAVTEVVKVLEFGRKKYAAENWRKVPAHKRRYFAAALRHLVRWRGGQELDPETGLPHLAHAACCVLFLLEKDLPPENSVFE